jgi:DNA invertase Pin-like site-specific DNA recombinase
MPLLVSTDSGWNCTPSMAKQERVRLSERTLAGLATARSQGRVGGRIRVTCDERRLLNLRSSGKSLAAIAGELRMSKTSVARMLAEAQRRGVIPDLV